MGASLAKEKGRLTSFIPVNSMTRAELLPGDLWVQYIDNYF